MTKYRIAVLMTCFNRKELTEQCLESLKYSSNDEYYQQIYLVNDGCTDGTPDMVINTYPEVRIINGDGTLFWNRGMHLAFSEAAKENYDFYLWVNDDVEFFENPVPKMLDTYFEKSGENEKTIIAGVTVDHTLNRQTYGGVRIKKSIIPLTMEPANFSSELVKCDTMHGNCVLIHKSVVDKIGLIDPFYQHAFGDADYGLRATRTGCEVWMTNYYVGICDRHDAANKWLDPKLSFKERRRDYHKKTANPPRDWKYFCKKFCGWNWWLRYWAPDVKIFVLSLLRK